MPRIAGLDHVGLAAKDPVALSGFYRDLFGMADVGHAPNADDRSGAAFLAFRSGQRHQDLVFFQEPSEPHVAFAVASLAELRAWHAEIKGRGLPILRALYHGDSFAFYFPDPEGHTVELCRVTGNPDAGGLDAPVDLEQPEAELVAFAERRSSAPSATGRTPGQE